MAVANTKENLACLAFAYFMKDPNYKQDPEAHKEGWIDIFRGFKIGVVESEYKEYLEPNFNYASLKNKYSFVTKNPSAHLYAVYNQMVSLFDSNILSPNKKYRIYGQNSIFVQKIKNECLERLHSIFKESFSKKAKAQDLTPADFYIVDSQEVNNIKKVFNETFITPKNDTTILLNYHTNPDKTYEGLIAEYFNKRELFPVSHKMPAGKNPFTSVKLAGNTSRIKNLSKNNIDPYSQLAISLQNKSPREVEKIINQIIEIKYDLWDIRENLSSSTWKLIFDFNYRILDPNFKDSRFALEALPSAGAGSFNGKFYIIKGEKKQTPWVAGMSPKSLEPFLKTYNGYTRIMSLLGKQRVKAFDSIIENHLNKIKRNKQAVKLRFDEIKKSPKYKECVKFLGNSKFHSFTELKNRVSPFFINIGIGLMDGLEQYEKEMITQIRKEGGFSTNFGNISSRRISEHYTSLQMSYFLFHGGQQFKLFLKKSIFYTIFGAITKRGFNKATGGNLVKKQFSSGKMFKNVQVTMDAAPHLILL